jgi:class 3 adenylate cyclase
MQELLEQYPNGRDLVALTDRELDAVVLQIVAARTSGNGLTVPKFLSLGELENIYGVGLSLSAADLGQINQRLTATYQRLLSAALIMPAPGQPTGVVTVTAAGRSGSPAEQQTLPGWAGGPRVTLAIVFTDIVDSTALNIELGDTRMREIREKHFARSVALVTAHAGYEVKRMGDGVMAVFRSVETAFDYASLLQLDPGWPELQIRAGIHIGPVDVSADDVDGAEVAMAARVAGSITGAEIWVSSRAKADLERSGTDREPGRCWHRHDVTLKGIGLERLWSLVAEPDGEGVPLPAETVLSAEERRAEAARRYFAPELARVIRQQIYILGRAVPNFITASIGRPALGDRWTSLRPAQPVLYPAAPEFSNLAAADATLLNEFYSLVQEIADIINGWIDNEPPPPPVNAWNFLMQKVRHSLQVGKLAAERFCPDREFDATMPASGTLIARMDAAISTVQPALDAHLAHHTATGQTASPKPRTRLSPSTGLPPLPRGPQGWLAR